jgi:hypothetical protein
MVMSTSSEREKEGEDKNELKENELTVEDFN